MGQQNGQCCGHKELANNIEYTPTQPVRTNNIVSKKTAQEVLATIARKKMQELPSF